MNSPRYIAGVQPYRFDRFELRPAERQLLIDGEVAALGARAFDVLLALLERRERVVSKSELFDLVWPDTVVEENNLAVHVSALRRLLGAAVITTIPGRGYRFTAAPREGGAWSKPRATARPDASAAPRPPSTGLKTNLPDALPALIGRDDDVERLGALIARHRLVTIVGAGGIGKTLLAQHVLRGAAGPTRTASAGSSWPPSPTRRRSWAPSPPRSTCIRRAATPPASLPHSRHLS